MIHIEGFRITSLNQLNEIKSNCVPAISDFGVASGAASAIPVPGLDIAADVGVMIKMFSALRSRYSLDTVNAADFKHYTVLAACASDVFAYVTKEGILKFLTKYGAKAIGKKTIAKYIPFVGTAIAAYTGYKLTVAMGEQYSENCYKLCREILNA